MNYEIKLANIAKEHGGIIETKVAAQNGISKAMLYKLCKENKIHRIVRGQYILPDDMQDELLSISKRSTQIIFSHETALFLHGISDRTPFEHTITAPSGCIPSTAIKSECKVYYIKPELFELGRTTLKTPAGNTVPVYDLERTVCDVIRSRNKMGTETFFGGTQIIRGESQEGFEQAEHIRQADAGGECTTAVFGGASMSNAMSLKAKIRNIAKQKNIPAQVILQNYMFERLLVRLSASEYKEKFVLKGGMLVAAIVGLDNRATMDLDTTLKNLPLTPEAIRTALESIVAIPLDDGISFEIGTISPIREDDIYGGYRVALNAKFDTLLTPMTIDVSTGDAITPHAIPYQFTEIFSDENSYELWAYNIETVMAEKVETILRRGVFNTRPRDFYDAYILATTQHFDKKVFADALDATAAHRGTTEQITNIPEILENIQQSLELQGMWDKYRKQFAYAKEIQYRQIMDVLVEILLKED